MKRVLGYSFLIFVSFLYFILMKNILFFSLGMGLCIYAFLYLHKYVDLPEKRIFLLIFVCAGLMGVLLGKHETRRVEKLEKYISSKKYIEVEGVVDEINRTEKGYRILLKETKEKRNLGGAYIYVDEVCADIGDRVSAKGEVSLLREAKNEGAYDERRNGYGLGIYYVMFGPKMKVLSRPAFSVGRFLHGLRERLNVAYREALPGEEGRVIATMCTGEKEAGINTVKELFRLAGILALLTISGTHVSCVSNGAFKGLRRMGVGFLWSGLVASVFAVLYGRLCGNGVSARRAVWCFVISVVAVYLGEAYDALTALAAVGFIMLFGNPFLAMNSSFVLSFGIVYGVIGVALPARRSIISRIRRRWNDRRRRETRADRFRLKIWERFGVYMVVVGLIQLFAAPIVAYFFYEVPTYSVFVNMLLMPLFPFLLMAGLVGGLLYLIGERLVSGLLLWFVHLAIYGFEAVADFSTRLPFARLLIGKPDLKWMFIYYLVLVLVFRDFYRFRKRVKVIAVCLLLGMFLIAPSRGFSVDMLYVGQGDGIHISLGDGVDLFVDGGSMSEKQVGKYTILPYLKSNRIGDVDIWFVTHPDLDHISGLIEVLEDGYEIGEIVTSKQVYESEAFSEVRALAERNGVEVHLVCTGEELEFQESTIRFVWPDSGFESDDVNDYSLGFFLEREGFAAFFGGDMSSEVEEKVFEEGALESSSWNGSVESANRAERSAVRLWKASHHGSNASNSLVAMKAFSPSVVIISAGEHNRYGHPGKDALKRMKRRKAQIYCTKWDGQISVFGDGKVNCFKSQK